MCRHRSFIASWFTALMMLILITVSTFAAPPVLTWLGGLGELNWTNTSNWNPSRLPQAGDQLAFTGGNTYDSTLVNDLPGLVTFDSLVFGQSFVLQGQAIGLTNGITLIHPDVNAVVVLPIRADTSQAFYVESFSNLDIRGDLSGGGLITKTGPGLLTLVYTNSWTGGLTVSEGKLLSYGQDLSTLGKGLVTLARGAQMELDGVAYENNMVLTGCAAPCRQQTLTSLDRERIDTTQLSGALALAGTPGVDNVYFNVTGGKSLQLTGAVSGGVGLWKVGIGTLEMAGSATNHLTGETRVRNGTLALFSASGTQPVSENVFIDPETSTSRPMLRALASDQFTGGTKINIASPGILDIQGTSQLIGCFAGNGEVSTSVASYAKGTLYINAPNGTCQPFTGILSGSGTIRVNSGAGLILDHLPSPFAGSVESMGETQLKGMVLGGSLTIHDGLAYLSDGVQVLGSTQVSDTLGFEGLTGVSTLASLQEGTNGSLRFFDQRAGQPGVIVTGPVALSGFVFFTVNQPPLPGQSLTLIRNDGAAPISGTFGGIPEGSMLCSGGNCYTLSYVGGDGNDLTLTRLEPVSMTFEPPQAIPFGQPLTLQATLTADNAGAGVPTGYVSFYYWANTPGSPEVELGTVELDAAGHASLSGVRLPIGSLTVEARYGGSAKFEIDKQLHTITVTGEKLFLPAVTR